MPILSPLRKLLRGLDDDSFILFIAWCLGALSPTGPYPLLLVSGQAGTGKSTLVRVANRLVDPCNGDLQQPPREDRDLIAAAKHSHLLAFDNLSAVSADLADSLCRLATGAEIGGRTLFTNHDSSSFAARRPVVLNGIPDLATRGDLLDRSVTLRLYPIHERRTEVELRQDLELALPPALRGLLDALVEGLAQLSSTPSPNMRMADFGRLVIAAEPALPWAPGAFLKAFEQSQAQALAALVDGDVVAKEIMNFSRHHPKGWSGLVSDLFDQLNLNADPQVTRLKDWPHSANWLSMRIDRIAAGLRVRGMEITNRRSNRGAVVTITKIAAPATPGDASDASADISGTRDTPSAHNGFAGHQ